MSKTPTPARAPAQTTAAATAAAAASAEEQREQKAEQVKTTLEEQRERQARSVAETQARMDNARPTPTQDEVDRARLGEDVTEKEDDGGEPEAEAQARTLAARHGFEYETKTGRSKK